MSPLHLNGSHQISMQQSIFWDVVEQEILMYEHP